MAGNQRISYVALEDMTEKMREEMERCVREGTPRPESSAVRAHVPDCFWFFANSWHNIFRNGVLDHAVKELCRVYVSRSVVCEFCGNQRSIKGQKAGLNEAQIDDLMNFERSAKYTDRQKAALAYAEAIVCASTPAMLSGRECTSTSANRRWWNWVAPLLSPTASRVGYGC